MVRIPRQRLVDFGVEVLTRRGIAEDTAAFLAEEAVATEARGIHTHGLAMLVYWDQEIGGKIDGAAEPEVVHEKGGCAIVAGKGGFAQLALRLAKEVAVAKAREHGIAMVAGTDVSWVGALGPHILSLSEAGFLAQLRAHSNASTECAPWGGIDGRFTSNPIAITFPTGALPVLGDFSTSAVSIHKARAMGRRGELTPENCFLDKHGQPSRDPRVMTDSGTILFLGGEHTGYRGYILSLWGQALAALGGSIANDPTVPPIQTFNLTVIDPAAFAGADFFVRDIARFLDWMRDSRLRPGFDAILLPGERAHRAAREAEAHGVPVEDRMLGMLNELAARHGIAPLD